MTPNAYALVGLTAIVAALVAVLTFALLRIASAARDTRSSLRGSGGDTALLTAALQDAVSKLKAQERAMSARAEASERLSGEIIASLTAGLLVVELGGAVRIINPAGRRLLGLGEEAPFDDYRQLPPPAARLATVIDECLRSRTPIVRRALELSGSPTSHLGVTVSPLFDEVGELHGAICLFTDLTAVIDLEEQVRLKDSLARVGELTAGIAHEFRNGLATIHGYSRLIDLDALPPAHRKYVEGIRAETDALGQVVTNFLNFAKPTQLTVTPVDLRVIAERVADEWRPDAKARGGDIVVSGTFGTVDGDDVLLRQAFSNLLRNAIDACAAARVAPQVTVDAEVDRAQRVCRISVNDNGPGIAPAARDRIFRPFFTTKAAGTGLGLALVLKIIVTHNGRITVGTSPLGGASLQVTLPLSDA
jgi:signal transduction histidine kinase